MNRKHLIKFINDYVDACIADSWSGGGRPSDIPLIVEQKKKAKKVLFNYIKKNTEP